MFDAYNVKKVLPRLLIAVVAIQLSWFLFTGMINLTNAVAYGIEGLILAPFSEGGEVPPLGTEVLTAIDRGGGTENPGAAASDWFAEQGFSFLVATGAGVAIALNIGGLLALAGTLLLGLFIGFFVLVLRQIVLLGLLVIAPVALVAWILPGTEKWWKLWWESFSKLLIMYPMILGMIAAGRAFGSIAAESAQSGATGTAQDAITAIIVIIAVIAPFFLIPKAFQLAGSAFASLTGIVNDRNKGLFDRLRNARDNARKQKWEDAKTGNYFRRGNSTNFRGRLNRAIAGGALIPKEGLSATRIRSALSTDADAGIEALSKTKEFGAIGGDDAKLYAARATTREEIARRLAEFDTDRFGGEGNRARREEAVAAIMRAQKLGSNETFQRARVRAQAKTGTGYQNQQTGQFEAWRMLEDINDAYGDDRNGAGVALAEMRSSLASSGQIAGMAGYGTWAQQLESSHQQTAANRDATRQATHNAIIQDTIDSVPPAHALHGKPASARALAEGHRMRIQQLSASISNGTQMDFGDGQGPRQATMDDLSGAVAAAAGIYDAMSQASPANASAFANELMGADIGLPAMSLPAANGGAVRVQGGTVREYIQLQMAGNQEFVNRRRDLSASTLEQARQISAAGNVGGQTNPLGPTAP